MKSDLRLVDHSNPSFLIYQHYKNQILSVRSSLFSSLKTKSERIAIAAENILTRKISSKYEKGLPHLFEIFPWLLKDLTKLDYAKAHEISINWLALYMYVSFLDDHLDLKTKIEPDEFIAASVLAQTGLINLFKIVDNTKYEDLFKECLIRSAKYELKDVLDQAVVCDNIFAKAESASGKNAILLACAGAVAASTEKDSDFIIDLTRDLLLSIQLLDDLTDLEEDLNQGNITMPLNDIAIEFENRPLTHIEIIHLLFRSNSLYKVLVQIESSLGKVVTHIQSSGITIQQSNVALDYFYTMLSKIIQLKMYIEDLETSFKDLSLKDQNKVINDLETKLTGIYCHT